MIVAVDLDNILNNFTEKILEIYNSQSGKHIQMSDLTSYDFADCLPKEDANGIIKLFKNKTMWDSLSPISGARDGLHQLIDDGHKVYIVTATSPESFPWKIQWLKKYFPFFNTENVVCMVDKSLFKCNVLIEDCMDQLIKNKLCYRICLDYPWNRSDPKDLVYDIRRVKDWKEILETINQIEKERLEWETR